jgi:hypothetical protein
MPAIPRVLPRSAAVLVCSLLASPALAATLAVAVDTTLDRRPISPAIYGVNFGDIDDFASVGYPVRRWGGNAVTRYSWVYDTHNTGSDWFFFNIVDDNPAPQNLPDGSSADRWVAETAPLARAS